MLRLLIGAGLGVGALYLWRKTHAAPGADFTRVSLQDTETWLAAGAGALAGHLWRKT